MLEKYNPKFVNKECFINQYTRPETRIDSIIEHLGYVVDAQNTLIELESDPQNKELQTEVWRRMCGIQHDMPVDYDTDIELQNLKYVMQKTNDFSITLHTPYPMVLEDLIDGFVILLKERKNEMEKFISDYPSARFLSLALD